MISQRMLVLFAMVLAIITWTISSSAQDADKERLKESTWRMILSLNTPNLVPPAVQFAILDKDPVPGFRSRAKRMLGFNIPLSRSNVMSLSWDEGFKEITGDRISLLTSSTLISSTGLTYLFSSNILNGRKWIVTKIVLIKGKPVCWCIPVEVEAGKETHITLTEDNILDLESAFDDAIGEPGQEE